MHVTARQMRQCAARVMAIGLASAALGACDIAFSGFREQASDIWTKSYPLSADGRVEIANTNGFIKVDAGDGSTVEVRAERIAHAATVDAAKELLKLIEVNEEIAPDRVRLETRRKGGGGFGRGGIEVRYTVRVPASARVELRSTNGELTATNLKAGVRLSTTNGAIVGRGLAGEVRASTTNGEIDMDLASLDQPLHASTTNGGVSLKLPSNTKADVHAQCTNGGISVSNLNLETEGEQTRRRVSGRLNGGGPRIDVSTTNGAISIGAK